MRFTQFRLEAVSLFAAALLAACGGGGSSGDATVATAGSAQGNHSATPPDLVYGAGSATLLSPVATSPVLPVSSGNVTADGVAYINVMRQAVGLPPLALDAGLTTASSGHVAYLVANQTTGHTETPGLPDYVGATPQARIEAQGNYPTYGEVVVAGPTSAFPDSLTPVQTLFDAPYHRIVMLDDFQSMGAASSISTTNNWEAFDIDFGNDSGAMSSSTLVAYPYAGQQGVPTDWFSNESPNPFASATQYEMTTVGYPVTIQGGLTSTLSEINFTITDASGNNVPCLAHTPQTDPDELSNAALCAPYQPFAGNTNYTVHVTGVLTAGGSEQPIDITWSFSTAVSSEANAALQGSTANRPLPLF